MKYISQYNLWWAFTGVMAFVLYWLYLGLFTGVAWLVGYQVPQLTLVWWSVTFASLVTILSVLKLKEKYQV